MSDIITEKLLFSVIKKVYVNVTTVNLHEKQLYLLKLLFIYHTRIFGKYTLPDSHTPENDKSKNK